MVDFYRMKIFKNKFILIFCFYSIGVFFSSNVLAASFDCVKATSKTEKLICSDIELSQLDENLAAAYKQARENSQDKEALKTEQLSWLKAVRRCDDGVCLKNSYVERIKILSGGKSGTTTEDGSLAKAKHPWKLIASGDQHTCVAGESELKCWGNNEYGVLNIPRKFNEITQLTSTWSSAVCAKDGQGWECWGACKFGICDIPKTHRNSEKLSSGAAHVCSLQGGKVACWGNNKYERTSIPSDLKAATNIAVSDRYSCAVIQGGIVKCWGSDEDGQITAAESLKNINSIYLGSRHACAFDLFGKLICSQVTKEKIGEFPNFGQSRVPEHMDFKYVATGRLHTCGVSKNNKIECWGANQNGQSSPPVLNKTEIVTAISVGADHSCALTTERVLCWGVYWNDEYTQPFSAKAISEKSLFNK